MKKFHHNRAYHEPKSHLLAAMFVCLLVGAMILAAWIFISQDSSESISQGKAESVTTVAGEQANVIISEPWYSFELPSDWKEIERKNFPQLRYITWAAEAKASQGRSLTVYIDSVPGYFGANRLMPVDVQGNSLTPGQLSDNCADFTDKNTPSVHAPDQGYRNSTWQGIKFVCDIARTNHNVLVTGTKDNGFFVEINGKTSGTHKYVLAYTDHSAHQDFQLFNRIIQSFKAK